MTGSYEKINYSLRPAKAIERKMLCDAFRRLSPFGKLESYRYVGFGSTYFSDFILFHKSLGIQNMISIEKDKLNEGRFSFNLPYKCINLEFGDSNDVLPDMSWNIRTINWLDYDGTLDLNVLSDINFLVTHVQPGSLITVSINAHPKSFTSSDVSSIAEKRLNFIKDNVGEDKIPLGIDGKGLGGWGTAQLYRRIIQNEIEQTLNDINGGRDEGSHLKYKQLFNFHYSDGAKMLTVGGILYDEGQQHIVEQCAFQDLDFTRTDDDSYIIKVPNLTYREIRHLDSQLPRNVGESLEAKAVPEDDINEYEKIYRYFPNFAEMDS